MRRITAAAAGVVLLSACGHGSQAAPEAGGRTPPVAPGSSTPAPSLRPGTPPSASASPLPSPVATTAPEPSESTDPRWRFYTDDRTRYSSPWYEGRHRLMIDFGCTSAPYYSADPRCPDGQGFHHGIDVAMPCGTPLRAGVEGRIRTGGLGSAYGTKAFAIRAGEREVVVGHAQELRVRDGQQVRRGDVIALAGALGAPDGCHLHLEQRKTGGGLDSATDPKELLELTA